MFNTLLQIDVTSTLAYIMAPKEDIEISTVKKASQATMDLFNKFLKEQIMTIVDSEKVGTFTTKMWPLRIYNCVRYI